MTQLVHMEDEEDAVPGVPDHGKSFLPDAPKDLLSEQKDGSSMSKPGMVMKNDSVVSPDLSESNETEMSVANTLHPDKPTTTEMRIHHNSMIDASKAAVLHERTTTEASKDTVEPLLVVTGRQKVPVLQVTKALPALTDVSSAATTPTVDVDSEVEHSCTIALQTDDLPVPTIKASSIPIAFQAVKQGLLH